MESPFEPNNADQTTKAPKPKSPEEPFREFDKTPLTQAIKEGSFIVPVVEQTSKPPEQKSKKGLYIGAAAAAVAIAAGAVFSVNAMNQPPKSEPVATAPAEPNPDTSEPDASNNPEAPVEQPVQGENDPVITAENEQEILQSLRFTSTMNPQEAGEKYSSIISRWDMGGATSKTFYDWLNAGLPDEEIYAAEIAKKNTPVYATALFGEDYAFSTNPNIINAISSLEASNKASLIGYLRTYGDKETPNSNTENIEPLQGEYKNTGVQDASQTEGELELIISQESVINDEKTMYAGQLPFDGHTSDTYITLVPNPKAPDSLIVTSLDIVDTN